MNTRIKDDYRVLTGAEKSAILILSLSEEQAGKVFEQMDDEEIREISSIMAQLGKVSSEVIEKVFIDFSEQISSTGTLVGSFESTERLLSKYVGHERVSQIMDEIRGPAGRTMWDKLGNVNEDVLANYLKNEYPQTVAVILSKIKTEHAANVLALLPESFAMEVVLRMLRMEPVQKEILEDIERTLRNEFMSNLARTARRDPHEMVAEMFNQMSKTNETRFLTALEERNKTSAERIRSLMFTFDDLANLDPGSVQTLLKNVDKGKLAMALKGASDPVKDLFFGNMSERASKIMKDDMAAMGMVRLKDVDQAQTDIVRVAKELAEKGEIFISEGGSTENEFVY